ncbi:MAG: GntR family transcriptional regulator [Myxococcales bacterium]|nr:GntR family transcriptional regulator [Myxococcales bacterium]
MAEPLPLHLSQTSGLPFYRQIEDQLAELIRSGQLPEGTRLPSVRELAAQTLVSLITIRRVYSDLAADGLIVRRQGQGTFVAQGVAAVSAERARSGARDALRQAVSTALQRGLSADEVAQEVADALRATPASGAAREAG